MISIPDGVGSTGKFTRGMTKVVVALAYRGSLPRAEIGDVAGAPERSARRFVERLINEGFASAATHRASVEFRIPAHAATFFFPDLYGSSL